jgi:hypothetical protein
MKNQYQVGLLTDRMLSLSLILDPRGLIQSTLYKSLPLTIAEIVGVIILALWIGKIVMRPISRHSFFLKAIKKMYMVRTKNPSFMDKDIYMESHQLNAKETRLERFVRELKDDRI